jgi:acyl carrier protein
MNDVQARLERVFRHVFDDDDLVLTRATTAGDVEGWDSIMHVTLMVNVEKEFKIKFSSSEIAGLKNVGELEDIVERRTGQKA